MSLKDLFGKTSEKIVSNKQLQDLYSQAESEGFLEQLLIEKDRFLPSVNFYTASNFARYGSAEKYYVDAIKNIYQNYPYDGSKKEQLEWRNNSSQLDLFVYDNIHPRTTGYVNLNNGTPTVNSNLRYLSNPSYISIKGGPNKADDNTYNNSNLYDLKTNRESNLGITNYGNTVEFWFKDNVTTSSAAYNAGFALFDLWNGIISGSTNYTRLTIAHTGSSTFLITYASGNVGIVNQEINYTLDKTSWHHYAFVFDNSSNNLKIKFFLDGNLSSVNNYENCGFNSLADNSNIKANIGCYIATSGGLSSGNESGASNGSYDDFRFWKVARTSQQIYRNWYSQVGGGSNTDDSNTNLGVYFKFNEGIIDQTSVNDIDKICLDYSGRVSNGLINNYNTNIRSTGSAIDTYFNEIIEEKTPILYSLNPLVVSKIEEYGALGAVYDRENNSSIYNSLPSWITDEAEVKELPDLQNLTQIISSYFDTLHNQIDALSTIKNVEYDGSAKPKPFIKNGLISNGFDTSELFNNSTFLEEILSKTEDYNFDDKISNVKNFIYQNIYNNLSYIYKSKGTEKSFRNLIRCFGVDDELIKINLYANNAEYQFNNSYDYSTTYKKFIDFNDPSRFESVIYQKAKDGDNNTKGYISGNLAGLLNNIPITLQTEVIFPRKFAYDESALSNVNFTDVSLLGVRTAKEDQTDLSFSENDDFNIKIFAIKNTFDSVDAYFKLVGNLSSSSFTLTSSLFRDVYDNQKWNFSVRIKPKNYGQVQQSYLNENSDYLLEFSGYNTLLDSNVNEPFKLTTNISKTDAESGLSKNKRIYLGANCNSFTTNSVVNKSDVKISSVRYWLDYLDDEELKAHSYDSSNYGRKYPSWNTIYTNKSIANIDTLLLNWDFTNVTSSDANGNFIVEDLSSGSLLESIKEDYGFYGEILKIQHPAYGAFFAADDDQIVNKEYIYSAKQKSPETFNGSDLIQVPVVDDVRQSKINKPVTYYFSIEKSISQVIDSEILNWFATIKEFNNLIGEPAERYNQEYKKLKHLRELFFNKVNNTPDVERFIEFYKWLDSSISLMIAQLVPASANISEKVRNVIESHLLERNKYENKLPRIERREEIVSNVSSHLDYSYIEQAAHTNNLTSSIVVNDKVIYEPLWLKNRVSRKNPLVSTSVEPQNDIDREIIRQVANNKYFNKSVTLYSVDEDIVYEGNEEKNRQFAKIYRFLLDKMIVVDTSIQATSVENYSFDSIQLNNINEESKITNQKKNFVNTYEYFNTVSRTGNNKSFVDAQGNVSGTFTNSGLGFYSRTLPNRLMEDGERRKTIISERFSAPGGPEVLSRGTLDRDGEEYSVYNELNNRNFRVRKNYNTWLAETSSIDSDNPSLHKVNKNAATLASNISGSTSRKQYDNEYVSHAIPRSDGQYAWVKRFVPSTGTLSGYLDDPFNSLNISYISSTRKFIDYEIPESPKFSYNITNSVSSSTNYSGALYDSGGNTGSYSVNERYYFTVIPTSSDGRTWDTGTSIGYTLSSSVSTSLSGNVFSKLRIYTADDPEQLIGKNFRFPDVWKQVNVVSGTTNISSSVLYLSGVLPSNELLVPGGANDVNVYSMDTSGSTVFMVGNFGYVSSSVSGVLAVPGFVAYNYASGTYSNPLTGSVGGLHPNPTTSSFWLPANIAYTKYNNSEYLIFAGYWHSDNVNDYIYSNSLTVYNLTIKKWNTYTRANGTEVSSMVKNLGGTSAYNNQFTLDLSLIVNSTASSQYVYCTGLKQRNLNGSTIYPETYGRNENKNLHYFSIDPDSPIFCSGTLYQTLMGYSMYGGNVIDNLGPTLPIAYVFDKDNNLYLGSNYLSGNAGDTEYYNIIKYDLKNNIKTPIRSNEEVFLRHPNGGGAGNTIITAGQVGKLDISGSILIAYSIGYGISYNVAAIYDLENDTITNVTGGISQFDYRQGQGPSRGFRGSFLINDYLYTTAVISWADYTNINRSYYKHDNRFEDANKLFRYHILNDNDNYFSPIIGNGEPSYTNYQGYGNYIDVGEGIKLGKNLPYDGITSSLYFAATLNGGLDFGNRKLVQFHIFDASKYYERTYPVKSYGSNITNSIDVTGSNFLVTWVSNDVTASGFQLSWNKQPPTIVKREEKTNFLGLRTNALSDYYFTDLQLSADLDKNLISFANKNTYTSSNALNDYLLNTNGPYKHASWRQIRNDKNPIVKSTRKNNRIIRQNNPNRGEGRSNNFTSYKEPPVDYNLPMRHDVLVANSNDIPVEIIDTYDNNLNKFSNEQLMADSAQTTRTEPQTHDILLNYSKDEIYRTQVLPITASYVQIVFPQKNNFGVSDARKRNNYNDSDSTDSVLSTNTFWRDNYENRRRIIDSFSAYGYYTSSFASLPNYSASVLNEIDRFIELKNTSSNLDTGSMTVFFDSYTGNNKFYESVFVLDNKSYNYNADSIVERSQSAENVNLSARVNFGEQQVGFLAPYKQPEHIYFITRPAVLDSNKSGSSVTDGYGSNMAGIKYANKRIFPRAQLIFTNHQPSYTFYPNRSGSKGGIEVDGDRDTLTANINYFDTSIGVTVGGPFSERTISPFPETNIYGNKNVASKFYTINNGYTYETDAISGKKPFYDSYEEFYEDIRGNSKNYSIITEYKINDYIDDLVINNVDLTNINTYKDHKLNFSIKGHDFDISKLNTVDKIEYINSSPINANFTNYDSTLIPQEININVNAIIKFLPYRGFYPADRVSQLSQLFIDSLFKKQLNGILDATSNVIYDSILSAGELNSPTNPKNFGGTPIDQQMLTMLQPFFAPGILLNTIKSSVATDWLAMFSDPYYRSNTVVTSYTTGSYLEEAYSGSDGARFYVAGTSSVIPYKLPFESIIDFEKYIPRDFYTCSLHYLDPTHYSSDAIGNLSNSAVYPSIRLDDYVFNTKNEPNIYNISWNDDRYKLAINNFLATIPDIFLKNKRPASIVSEPLLNFKEAVSGTTYYMDVVLERPTTYKPYVYDRWHDYLDKQKNSKFSYASSPSVSNLKENEYGSMTEDSIFGPPIKFWYKNKFNDISNGATINYPWQYAPYRMVSAPAYAPYVPPYYYGKSIARISFTAPAENKKYNLEEIFSNISIEYINEEMDNLFISRNLLFSAFSLVNDTGDPWKETPAYKFRSNLSSSINLLGKKEISLTDLKADGTINNVPITAGTNYAWSIQLKYETPSINFNKVKSPLTQFIGGQRRKDVFFFADGYIDGIYSQEFKGLWTSYGEPVKNEDAITFKVIESPNNLSEKQGSLLDLCGFKQAESEKVGILADNAEFTEAVVVIPYVNKYNNYNSDVADTLAINQFTNLKVINDIEQDNLQVNLSDAVNINSEFLFKVDTTILKKLIPDIDFSNYSKNRTQEIIKILNANRDADGFNNSILKTIDLMTKYVLPPPLDWINNNLQPFVMYIFEFKKSVDKNDLSDLWQNVMPNELREAEKVSININHRLSELEFFHGKKLPPNIKFKIFKVKKRAKYNYYDLTDTIKDNDKFNYQNAERFKYNSYNWPYDFYSLVELVNVETTVKSEYKKVVNDNKDNSLITPVTSPLLSKEIAEAVKKLDLKKNKF